jgi:23S rRNA pseudouridine2605 synthase
MLQRLQKIIAQAGIASRRHAEELIRSGQVRVNGEIVTELGSKADPEHDRVEVAGRVAEIPDELVYMVLNKPPQVVSTMADPEGRKTLRHFLRGAPERVFPVGRLDYAASGLVLLTSDGQLAARVLRASGLLRQTYWIKVKGRVSETEMHEAGRAASAHFSPLKGPWARRSAENPWYEIELTGASRDALGRALTRQDHPIEKMKRVQVGTLELGNVPEGHYRRLEPDEVDKFSRAVDRALAEKDAPPVAGPVDRSLAAPAPTARTIFTPQQQVTPPQSPASPQPFAPSQRDAPPTRAPQSFAASAARPPLAAPRTPWQKPSSGRAPERPREPWRARKDSAPPRKNAGTAPGAPRQPWPGAPKHRPASPHAKDEWRPRKSGPWGKKSTGAARSENFPRQQSPNQMRPGAPTHRPGAPAKQDWRAQKSGPWRGNKPGGAPSSPTRASQGGPAYRPGAPPKKDWGERKPGAWRGNKTGGAPRSPSHPPSGSANQPRHGAPSHRPGAPGKQDWRANKSRPWRGKNTGGPPRSSNHPPSQSSNQPRPGAPTHRPGAPPQRPGAPAKREWRGQKNPSTPKRGGRPDRDPRHTPRYSR